MKNRNKHKEENGQTKQQRTNKISIKQERNRKRPTLNPENQAIQQTQVPIPTPEPITIPIPTQISRTNSHTLFQH